MLVRVLVCVLVCVYVCVCMCVHECVCLCVYLCVCLCNLLDTGRWCQGMQHAVVSCEGLRIQIQEIHLHDVMLNLFQGSDFYL